MAAEPPTPIDLRRVELHDIQGLRDMYREEMRCQIIHDSIHVRPGWSEEYLIMQHGAKAGYGSIAIAGPWKERRTIYEFYLLPQFRLNGFDCFTHLVANTGAAAVETQSNDPFLTPLIHQFCRHLDPEAILFRDWLTTSHPAPGGASFQRAGPDDLKQMIQQELDREAKWIVTVNGAIAAAGDILYHYNRPYGDIYMKVAEAFRRRGIGAYLVQELKRVCYDGGSVPAARCNRDNLASRKTLQRAGFLPCGHILNGALAPQVKKG